MVNWNSLKKYRIKNKGLNVKKIMMATLITVCAVSSISAATTADEACRAGKPFKLYQSADKISIYRQQIVSAQKALADDDAAAKIGGISNSAQRYKAYQTIVRYTRWTNEEFIKYKQLGGTALNAESINAPKSPCW